MIYLIGTSGEQVFLRFAAVILVIFCGIRTVMEIFEFLQRRGHYLKEIENYLELLLIVSTAIFAIAGHAADCFCVSSFSWQFGAAALFLGWIDLIVYLKKLPLTGIRINMLQSVVITFVKLFYLPAILVIAFALPFYMLFSRVSEVLVCKLLATLCLIVLGGSGEFFSYTSIFINEIPSDVKW